MLVSAAVRADQSERLRVGSVRSQTAKEQALITCRPRAYCSEFLRLLNGCAS
jgi:hypothetical protein